MYKLNKYPKFSQALYRILRAIYFIGMLSVTFTAFRFPSGFGITVSDWVFLLCYLLALHLAVFRQTVPSILTPSLVSGIFLFTISATVSTINAGDPSQSILNLIKFLFVVVLWLWVSGFALPKFDYIELAVGCWLTSAIICSAAAIIQLIWGNIFPVMFSSWGRMAGFSQHPNEMGLISSTALIPLVAKFSFAKTWKRKCLWLAGFAVTISGLVLSASISSLIGAMIAFVVWFNFLGKKKIAIALLLIILTIGFGSLNYQEKYGGQSYIDRFRNYQQETFENTTLGSRLMIYNDALSAISKNIFIGRGLDMESLTIEEYQIHNMLLLVWFGGGGLAFLGILLILISVWRMARRNISYCISEKQKTLSQALYVSYIVSLIGVMSGPVLYRRTAWVPMVLIVAMYALIKRNISLRI